MRPLPDLPFTSVANIPRWSTFHHIIQDRAVPVYLTPGGKGQLDSGKAGSAELAADLRQILAYCMADPPARLCAIGSRWSLSNVLDPANLIVDTGAWDQIIGVQRGFLSDAYAADTTRRGAVPVVVEAGATVRTVNNVLGQAGLALQTSGANDGHRFAGCIATGTHGSHLKVGAVHDTVMGVYLVTGPDKAVLLQPAARLFNAQLGQWFQDETGIPTDDVADDELYQAARVALGGLGFVHSLIVEAVPLYQLRGTTVAGHLDNAAIWRALDTMDTSAIDPTPTPDFLAVVLSPFAGTSETGAFATVLWKQPPAAPYLGPSPVQSAATTDLTRVLSALIPAVDGGVTHGLIGEIATKVTASQYHIGPVQAEFPGTYFGPTSLPEGNGRSSEVVVNQTDAGRAVRTVLAALQSEGDAGRHLLGALGIRFVPGTSALLGTNIHPMNTYIEFPSLNTSETDAIHQAVWKALAQGGIPFTCHWGQEYGMTSASVRSYFGDRIDRWKAARARLLPTPAARAVFTNPLLKALQLDD
jgi:FAD/FMN-containing dehydrogenase